MLPIAVDKYLIDPEPGFARKVGKMICNNCFVMMQCRLLALSGRRLEHGIHGGVTANEINTARSWRDYENGLLDKPPRERRPEWLPFPESAQLIESLRVDGDSDELGDVA
jgi:hypothetical protein